jgi:hypothetical protein
MHVVVDADCGNAPKKALVRDWLIAAAKGDTASIRAHLAEQARWETVGETECCGVEEVAEGLAGLGEDVAVFRLDRLLSHGKHVAVDGSVEQADGASTRFAHFIEFDGHGKKSRIASIVTYVVPVA